MPPPEPARPSPPPPSSAAQSIYLRYHRLFPDIPTILSSSLRFSRDAAGHSLVHLASSAGPRRVILVDVRTAEERAVSTLPGAVSSIDLDGDLGEAGDALTVTYCTVGFRSGRAARLLRRRGREVAHLDGILAYTHSGNVLVDGGGAETREVHVFGPEWAGVGGSFRPVTFGRWKMAVEGCRMFFPKKVGWCCECREKR